MNTLEMVYVEDDSVTRTIVLNALVNKGISVRSAKNGTEAFQLCREKAPDMILSDCGIVQSDSVELVRKIRSTPGLAATYFILLTANHHPNHVVEVLSQGADDYVTKPVSIQELIARIRTGYRVTTLLKELQEEHAERLRAERIKVMLESTGAASHHLSQPLTALILSLEMLLEEQETLGVQHRKQIKECLNLSRWMQEIVYRFQRVVKYKTEPYDYDSHILDIGLDQTIDQWLWRQTARTKDDS